ncbi:MAG TPA: phytanoyl-CoA dioxygenase family protein [Tepidisphaeraceae bacterium]|jgi:ectoine hydroxylase-related dioxygenase (phytanoyl-CoA dioxygenase family)|nr:phytanoyl-CoA dioxygenase family protein [Tepidisphaeraceae bacterium]
MLNEQQIAFWNENGYVLGGRVLEDAQVDELRAEVLRVIADRENRAVKQPVLVHNMGSAEAPIWQIVNTWMASNGFYNLIASPTICEEVAQLHEGAEHLRIWHDQIQFKPAAGGGVNMWHQDSPYWGILTPKHAQVTAWVALDDVDTDNGCMRMVPRSHLWGNAIDFLHTLKTFEDMEAVKDFNGHKVDVVTCPVKKGHVHYHHSLTWHGSNRNLSQRPRRAIALHYMTEKTRYLAGGTHLMKQFVSARDGEELTGDAFPIVWKAPQPDAVGV